MPQIRVLIVGDQEFAKESLVPRLVKSGYEVSGVISSGEEALEAVSKAHPDLVLMDVQLQGEVDGIETAERMRRDFGLPVIFLAAHADAVTLDRAKLAEPLAYLKKPFRTADLASAMIIGLHKHRKQQQLKDRETWLKVAIDSAGDGVIVTDASGRIRYLNQLSKKLLSLPDGDADGQEWTDVVRLQNKVSGALAGNLAQLAILQGETIDAGENLTFVGTSGERRDLEGEVALCHVDDKVSGTVFTFRDVTLRNRQQEQARQEIRSQANAQLISSVSGEISTLLQAALQYSDEAIAGIEADHVARTSLEAMKSRVDDLSRIARQLFTLNSTKVSFPKVNDLNALISETCSALRKDLPAEIALVTDLSPDLGEVRADAAEIRRAISDLTAYSGKSMKNGGEITIATRNYAFVKRSLGEEVERYVIVTIKDTGPGMTPEQARRLFDPFSRSGESGGSDLGLFVVQSIIADARGSISVTANPGEGTAFEILLPRAAMSNDNASPVEVRGAHPHETALLLVEADPGVRNLIANRLEGEGFELLGARNSAEAMSWSETYEGTISMLVTDMVMPDMSGPELAQRVLLRHPALMTVFISDQPVDDSVKETWSGKGASFLAKPFQQDVLAQLARGALAAAGNSQGNSLPGLTVD